MTGGNNIRKTEYHLNRVLDSVASDARGAMAAALKQHLAAKSATKQTSVPLEDVYDLIDECAGLPTAIPAVQILDTDDDFDGEWAL